YDHEAPLSPRSLDDLVRRAADRAGSEQLATIAAALGQLPHALQTDSDAVEERHRDKEKLLGTLGELCDNQPRVAVALASEIEATNQDHDALDALLQRQNYR